MYEAPKLICVGDAHKIVRGSVSVGGDLDGTFNSGDMIFAEESLPDEQPPLTYR